MTERRACGRSRQRIGAWLAAVGGAAWCSSYTWPIVDPAALEIVLRGDWAQHTLGWLFFRREPLLLPLGSLPSFLYPVGTTLGYMDSIPWVALLLRPFSGLLPEGFQYLGLWIVLCSAALAFVGARVCAWSTPHWEQQALCGVLIAAAPTLIERLIHPALCAHVYLVAAIALYFVDAQTPRAAKRVLLMALALLTLSTATHPYLACMVLLLIIALPWYKRVQLGAKAAWLLALGLPLWLALELALFGYLDGATQTATRGFGAYSANLNTFINSMGLSRFFAALPQATLQYEGYCYLGAGSFAICAAACVALALPSARAKVLTGAGIVRCAWPVAASLAMAMFALASPVRWGTKELLRIDLYEHVAWLAQTFRASGRFIWPLYYLLTLGTTVTVLRALSMTRRRVLASSVLALALGLQLYDVDTSRTQWLYKPTRVHALRAEPWSLGDSTYRHLVVYPAEIQSVCAGPLGYRDELIAQLAYLAYRHGWTFNSGYVARVRRETLTYCEELKARVERGELDAHSIYVVGRWSVPQLRKAGAVCGRIDGVVACVQRSGEPFARFLATAWP